MPRPHLDDEELSALVDGGVDAVEAAAHVRDCADCGARLTAFRSAAALVGAPVPALAEDRVDELVGRALEAASPSGPSRHRLASGAALVALAAAIALLLGVRAVVGGGEGDTVATGTTEARTMQGGGVADSGSVDAAKGGTGGDAATAAQGEAMIAAPAVADAHLGAFDDEPSLVRALVARLSQTEGGGDEAAATCEDEARSVAGSRVSSRTYQGAVVWRGQEARVLVFVLTEPVGEATRQAFVMSVPTCAVLAEPRF